jgi:hypothetical protein
LDRNIAGLYGVPNVHTLGLTLLLVAVSPTASLRL